MLGKRNIKLWLLCALAFLFDIPGLPTRSESWAESLARLPSQIIANVQANEELYAHLEVRWRKHYSYNAVNGSADSLPPFIARTMTEHFHSVIQEDKSYLDYKCDATNFSGEQRTVHTRDAYDGKMGRKDSITMGHIYRQRHDSNLLFRPHTWPLLRAYVASPLSTWLRGGKELQHHPSMTHRDTYITSFLGTPTMVHSLHCVCAHVELRAGNANGNLIGCTNIFLAPERNYLPLKIDWYLPDDRRIAYAEEIVDDLREIKPGVWFPFYYQVRTYDTTQVVRGEKLLKNQESGVVEFVSLEPNHPDSFFSDVPFAKGAVIYEVTGDKVVDITEQYWRGQGSSRVPRYVLLAVLTLGAGVAVVLIIRQWRTRGCSVVKPSSLAG